MLIERLVLGTFLAGAIICGLLSVAFFVDRIVTGGTFGRCFAIFCMPLTVGAVVWCVSIARHELRKGEQ